MKKASSVLLFLSFLCLLFIQTGCESSGSVEIGGSASVGGSTGGGGTNDPGGGSAKGEVKVSFGVKVAWSPKPTVFDEAIILDLLQNFKTTDTSITVKATVTTDTGYTKTGTFIFNRNTALTVTPYLQNAAAYLFKPADKAAVDMFIKDALAKSDHLTNLSATFTSKISGTVPVTKTALTKSEIGVRLQFLPNETPAPLPITKLTFPIKTTA
jgi:hypothetical protein